MRYSHIKYSKITKSVGKAIKIIIILSYILLINYFMKTGNTRNWRKKNNKHASQLLNTIKYRNILKKKFWNKLLILKLFFVVYFLKEW